MVGPPGLEAAYSACERLARRHYENFPVASLLLPAHMRRHVAALYAFARVADDFADEGDLSGETRETLLDAWTRALEDALAANAESASRLPPAGPDIPSSASSLPPSVFCLLPAVAHTIRTRNLPVSLFLDLIDAFRQDVRIKRYAAWEDVFDYCRRSANPVGRLVLRIAGYEDPELDRRSDAVCTALQLTNFWQDLERDWQKGRLYVPQEELRAAGAREEDLAARRLTPEWRRALRAAAGRTRALFNDGRAVADPVRGRLRWELRLTWLGGIRVLDRLEAADFDVFRRRPTLSIADAPGLLWNLVTW